MFANNVELTGPAKMSAWRKIAMGTWRSAGDPSIYATVEIDATNLLQFISRESQEGRRITPTVVVAKAAALSLREFPILNTVRRFGRLYQRKDINIFLQVSPDSKEDNLSGVLIRNCDHKSPADIAVELQRSARRIKVGDDFEYKKMKNIFWWLPSFLVGPLLSFFGYILYALNLWSPLLNAPKDAFGSMMVTSVGMLGIENGFAPLVPYSRCPALMAVGEIKDRAVVVDKQIVIRPILSIGVTLDHRQIDGKGASYMLKAFRSYLNHPV